MSLTTGGHHPSHSQKVRFQGNTAPAAPAGLGIGGFGKIITDFARREPGETAEKFFLNTAKEGPMAIVPLESSVLVGRSERAYKRDGWLELQERLSEEMAAAVVWLFGVGFLQNQFETVSNKLSRGKNKHLSTNIAWNMPWKKVQNIDLTPQEMFSRNNKEINTLLKLKSARWLFSVGTALALVGYFIPKGNQLKTNMILKHLERRKRASEGSNVQFGDPNQQNQPNGSQQRVPGQAPVHPMAPPQQASTFSHSLMPHMPVTLGSLMPNSHFPAVGGPSTPQAGSNRGTTGIQSNAIAHPLSTQFLGQGQPNTSLSTGMNASHGNSPRRNSDVRFGSGLPLLSGVEAVGAAVEQTNYGQLLAVDFGIAGGRGYVASKRSPYETAEVLFRDIVSLYFYILCAPHLMKLLTTGMDKSFGSSSHLQPKVAELLHDQIKRGLDNGLSMDRIVYGLSNAQMKPGDELKEAMRSIDKTELQDLMKKEMKVYLSGKHISADIDKAIEAYITPSQLAAATKNVGALNPSYIQHLLQAIDDGRGAFGKLSGAERQNLGIAVKQAARHTVGMRVNLNDVTKTVEKEPKDSKFKELIDSLENGKTKPIRDEAGFLKRRISRIAELEGMNQTHSMLRRSVNILREKLSEGEDAKLVQLGDAHANWLDKAMHHAETIKDHFTQNLEDVGSQLHGLKLEGESLKNISSALGGKTLHKEDHFKEAVSKASTNQLQRLALEVKELYNQAGKPSKLWPMKTQSGRLKGLNESLEDINLRLTGGTHTEPVEALRESIMHFMSRMKDHGKATSAERDLLGHYQQEIQKIVQGKEGRMFSLAIRHEDEALGNKLREILRGGLISDSRLVKKALITVGQLETDTRKMPSPTNESNMRKSIANYTEALYKRYNPANTGALDKAKRDALHIELETYKGLNRNLHYIARGLSLGTAMACIGWLVPIVQTKITKHLTGKDKNPGIASAKKLMDDAETKAGEKKDASPSGQATLGSATAPAKAPMASTNSPAFQSSTLPFQPPRLPQTMLPIIAG